jgi:hypothetical protein
MPVRIRSRATAVVAAASIAVAGVAVAARGAPHLRPVPAERLIASTLEAMADPGPVSGQLRTHVALGLPSLPGQAGQPQDPTARALDAINGDHRVRLWRSDDGLRLAELLPTAELGLVVRRSAGTAEAWAWDSVTFTAYRFGPVPLEHRAPAHPQQLFDPEVLARLSLEAVAPTTHVFVGEPVRVAGRDAYRLVIEPRSEGTLVGRVELFVDAARWIPLGVAVFARGAGSPALSVAFETVGFGPIDPATFTFTPPPGASVVPLPLPSDKNEAGQAPPPRRAEPGTKVSTLPDHVRLFGAGWETVLAYRVSLPSASTGDEFDFRSLLPLSGSLFSVRLAERGGHGWLLFGAVPQARLAALERALP